MSENLADAIQSLVERLTRHRHTMTQELSGFSVFSTRFVSLLSQAKSDIEALVEIRDGVDRLIQTLETIQSAADDPAERSHSGDELIESIIKRFTIAKHKSTVASFAGLDIESGDDEGELTLF